MPSAVKVGVRPISAMSRAYSSGLRPCATASFSSTLGSVSLKGVRSFSLGETLGPLALSRDDLKSLGRIGTDREAPLGQSLLQLNRRAVGDWHRPSKRL